MQLGGVVHRMRLPLRFQQQELMDRGPSALVLVHGDVAEGEDPMRFAPPLLLDPLVTQALIESGDCFVKAAVLVGA